MKHKIRSACNLIRFHFISTWGFWEYFVCNSHFRLLTWIHDRQELLQKMRSNRWPAPWIIVFHWIVTYDGKERLPIYLVLFINESCYMSPECHRVLVSDVISLNRVKQSWYMIFVNDLKVRERRKNQTLGIWQSIMTPPPFYRTVSEKQLIACCTILIISLGLTVMKYIPHLIHNTQITIDTDYILNFINWIFFRDQT